MSLEAGARAFKSINRLQQLIDCVVPAQNLEQSHQINLTLFYTAGLILTIRPTISVCSGLCVKKKTVFHRPTGT